MNNSIALIGYASGMAAQNIDCALGPWYLYYHSILQQRVTHALFWETILKSSSSLKGKDVLTEVEKNLQGLSEIVLSCVRKQQTFCVIGGDHSCAIGTWSAVAHAYRKQGNIGLIWIDAHMDSHTPETSETQNIHGMPVAHLLGHGVTSLCHILDTNPKLKPEHVCLIGIRAYETGEQTLLQQLGVKIYFMEEVKQRGVQNILKEAVEKLHAHTCGFGVSIDIDAIDPKDAPGVGYRETDGIDGKLLQEALREMPYKERILGCEIAEYNPIRDENGKTAVLLMDLIQAIYE